MVRTKDYPQRKKRNARPYLLVIPALIVVAGLLGGVYIWHKHRTTANASASVAVQQQQAHEQANQKKADTINQGKGSTNSGTYTPPTSSDNITLTPSQNGSQVTLMTKLAGYSDGTCNLTITNGDQTYTKSAEVIYQAQFSTCAGFSVPVSSLGAGTWNINLSVISGGVTTASTTTLAVH